MAPLSFTDVEFDQILRQAEESYSAIGHIRCPYFRESVQFNALGLDHLRHKAWNRGRERRDQFMRLKYIALAPEILRMSHTVQGIQETDEWERRHRHGRWERQLMPVIYYEFVAVLDKRRFKVIIKQSPGGARIFWSLIPFWRQSEQGSRILHDGNPSED
jgi:hypothetical protein